MRKEDTNVFLAFMLSVIILVGFIFLNKKTDDTQKTEISTPTVVQDIKKDLAQRTILGKEDALNLSTRTFLENDDVIASINLQTGSLDDLVLKSYKETTEENSPSIRLLSPRETKDAYWVDFLVEDLDEAKAVSFSQWSILSQPNKSEVILENKASDFKIKRHIKIVDDYLFEVQDVIENSSGAVKKIRGKVDIQRLGSPEVLNMSILHEGVIGVLGGKLKEITYKDIDKNPKQFFRTKEGWVGFTDKYWMTSALMHEPVDIYVHNFAGGYSTEAYYPVQVLKPQEQKVITYKVFSGAKELSTLEKISEKYKVKSFDLAVDFGWFYFITKPLFKLLSIFKKIFKNFGISLLIVTLLSKVLLLPMGIKSQRSMQAMQKVQARVERIKEKYPDDKIKQNQEIMLLYQQENIKPMAGCLPLLVQIPIFFCLYKVLYVTIEMRHEPFLFWIKDLSMPDPLYVMNLFGFLNFDVPHVLQIGLWPVIMGITMYAQQKMTPSMSSDPAQEKAMMMLPFLFTYMFASFPAGLVIYWTWSNILTILQQWLITKYSRLH